MLHTLIFLVKFLSSRWSQKSGPMETRLVNSLASDSQLAGPVPRCDHRSAVLGAQLFILGGTTIDAWGRSVPLYDCWMWDAETTVWQKIEFCVAQWSQAIPLIIADEAHSSLVVTPDFRSVYRMKLYLHDDFEEDGEARGDGLPSTETLGGYDSGAVELASVYSYPNQRTPSKPSLPQQRTSLHFTRWKADESGLRHTEYELPTAANLDDVVVPLPNSVEVVPVVVNRADARFAEQPPRDLDPKIEKVGVRNVKGKQYPSLEDTYSQKVIPLFASQRDLQVSGESPSLALRRAPAPKRAPPPQVGGSTAGSGVYDDSGIIAFSRV